MVAAPMKVIVLTPNYPRRSSRINGIFIHQQIKALVDLGVECHVLLTHNWFPPFGLHKLHPYWRSGYKEKQSYFDSFEGVPIHHIPIVIKLPSRFFHENAYFREARAIARFIRRSDTLRSADWIFAHFLTDYGYIGALVKQELSLKLATIARGDDVHAWPKSNYQLRSHLHYVFDHADILLANSKRLANDVTNWFPPGFRRDVIAVYNGIDFTKYSPIESLAKKESLRNAYNLPRHSRLLLCAAAPVQLKGWLELFDALKLVGSMFEDWKLVTVFPSRTYMQAIDLEAEVRKRGLTDRVVFKGQIDSEFMPDCFRCMDAFILPSHNEGMSNALLEAMATGLPVIATDVGGHAEVVEDGVSGLLIAPEDSDAIVVALKRILNDESFRKRLGTNARSAAGKIGTYRMNAEKIRRLLIRFQ
jgi:teichuronic acid biosynthesis glycosyltransferase TuaC